MRKAYPFYNDTFLQPFFFLPNWTSEDIYKTFKMDISPEAQGMVFSTNRGIYIWIREFTLENLSYLTHESIHAANCMFQEKGHRISANNDEVQAYVSAWIFDKCMKSYKPKKK